MRAQAYSDEYEGFILPSTLGISWPSGMIGNVNSNIINGSGKVLCNEGDKIMFISSRRNSYVAYKLTGKRGIPCLEDKFPISEQQKDDYVEITEVLSIHSIMLNYLHYPIYIGLPSTIYRGAVIPSPLAGGRFTLMGEIYYGSILAIHTIRRPEPAEPDGAERKYGKDLKIKGGDPAEHGRLNADGAHGGSAIQGVLKWQ